jgi:hypothetical protein
MGSQVHTNADGWFEIDRPDTTSRLAIEHSDGIWQPGSREEATGEVQPANAVYRLSPLALVYLRGFNAESGETVALQVPNLEVTPRLTRVEPIHWSGVAVPPSPGLVEVAGVPPADFSGDLRIRARGRPDGFQAYDVNLEAKRPLNVREPEVLGIPLTPIADTEFGTLEIAVHEEDATGTPYVDVVYFDADWGGRGGQSNVAMFRPTGSATQRFKLPAGRIRVEPPNVAMFLFSHDSKGRKEIAYRQFGAQEVTVKPGEFVQARVVLPKAAGLRLVSVRGPETPAPQRLQVQFETPVPGLPFMLQYLEPVDVVTIFAPSGIRGKVTVASPGRRPVTLDVDVPVGDIQERSVSLDLVEALR